MPVTVEFTGGELVPLLNSLALLVQWLRPGKLALTVGRLKSASERPAVDYSETREKMIDELVMWNTSEQTAGQPADDKKRTRRTRIDEAGRVVYEFGPNADEFERREKEMRESIVEITFGRLLTDADIEKIEKERIERPKDPAGNPIQLQAVDFGALAKIIELDTDEKAAAQARATAKETKAAKGGAKPATPTAAPTPVAFSETDVG